MSQFRIKKIDTGLPDEWVLRTNDDGATLGDDIVAEDPNDLAAALTDTQELLLKASVYSPAALIDTAHGVLERIKIIEDGVGTTSLQSAYENGNYINPTPGRNLILGAGGVIEIDSSNNLSLNPTTMKIYSGSQQLDFTKNSITTSTTNLTLGTTGSTRDLTVTAGNDILLKDKYLSTPVKLSQLGSTALATTAQSIIGAINEIKANAAAVALQQVYNQSSPPKITTTLAGGKLIIENGTGNSLTPAVEVSGILNVTGEAKAGSFKVGPGITVNTTIDSAGLITTASHIVTSTEVRTPTVRATIGSLVLADTLGSAALTTSTDSTLTTTKQSIFGAINELKTTTTSNSSALAAFAVQHDSSTGNHKIITTRADSGANSTDRILVKNDSGVDVVRMNGLGEVRANSFILPTFNLGNEATANAAHRAGDGTDHSAFATHIAASNPHNTVKFIQAQGSPLLTGTVILKPGPGATLTQVGQEIEISAAAGSTLQGVYDTQPTGALVVASGKELFFKDISSVDIASFEQTGSFFHKPINMRNASGINSNNNLAVETNADLTLRSTGSNVVVSTVSGHATVQGIQFAPNGVNTIPSYLPQTLSQVAIDDAAEKYALYTNNSHVTIDAGTALTVNGDSEFWTPVTSASLADEDTWLGTAIGVATTSIAPGATGRVKVRGAVTAQIGQMDGTTNGDFQIGDSLYVARQGYAEVEFTGSVANNSTITVDAAGSAIVFTAVNTGALASTRKFQIDNTNKESMMDNFIQVVNDPLSMASYSGISFRAFADGVRAGADVLVTGVGTAGDTLIINGTAVGGTSVTLTAVAAGTKSNAQQYEIATSDFGTARNIAEAINDNSRRRVDNSNGHFCTATIVGKTIRISRRDKGELGNSITLSTTSAALTVPANLTGGKSYARIFLFNRNASGKTMATSTPGTIRVVNFTSDESESQYIAARYLLAGNRRALTDEKIIKVGKITAIAGSDITISVAIEDRDVPKA